MRTVSKIAGIGMFIPSREISNGYVLNRLKEESEPFLRISGTNINEFIGNAEKKILKAGSKTRYWCRENEYCTDIAIKAAQDALTDANMEPDKLDLIIFTGMSKALIEPATAHIIRHGIRAVNANVIDTQDACTSFMKSIDLADSLIKTGKYNKIMIVCGERTFDWGDFCCKTESELDWKIGSLTIGDGAGAIVLESTNDPVYTKEENHFKSFYNLGDGDYTVCHIGLNHLIGERYKLYSHSGQLIKKNMELAEKLKTIFLNNFQDDYINNIFLHDIGIMANNLFLKFFTENNVDISNFKSFFPEFGNIASASFPVGLCLAKKDGRLKRGNNVLFVCPAAGPQIGLMLFKY